MRGSELQLSRNLTHWTTAGGTMSTLIGNASREKDLHLFMHVLNRASLRRRQPKYIPQQKTVRTECFFWEDFSLFPSITGRKLRGKWHGGLQGAGLPGRSVHCPLGQDLQQRGREALWSPSEETTGTSTQGARSCVFLRRHDCPRSPDGHEETGGVWGIPPHRQVRLFFFFLNLLI